MRTFAQKPKATQQNTSAKSTIPGRAHFGQSREVNSILHLQDTIGNQAVRRLLEANTVNVEGDSTTTNIARFGHDWSRIPVYAKVPVKTQTKLTVNTPGDVYEQEADRIADQVMATPTYTAVSGDPPRIQRFSGQSNGQMDATPASVDHALAGPGRPLEPELRQDMEQRFGHDFSRVRVHSGTVAEQSAREVNAHAYTVGHNIVFAAEKFAPNTREGRWLLVHELTHVVQQSGADGMNIGHSNENGGLSPNTPTGSDPYSRSLETRKDRSVRDLTPRPGRPQFNKQVLQRRVLDDISIDSADFWTHLRSRTFTRLVAWIGDSRQKLNAFVATLGESETPSQWGAVVQSWIGVFGTGGDLVNAFITSFATLSNQTDSPLTLSQFRAQLERNFDILSTQVTDMNSGLPIYVALQHAESQEFVREPSGPVTMGERQAKKDRAKKELETALSALPTPNALERSLVLSWIKAARNVRWAGGDPHIFYRTRYELEKWVRGGRQPGGGYLPAEYGWSARELENDFKPAIRVPSKGGGRGPVPHVEQTLKALRTAFGDSFPIDKLDLPMRIEFMVIPSYYGHGRRLDTKLFSWSYEPGTKTWVPLTGLGEPLSEDRSLWPEDAQGMVIRDWIKNGRKPTTAEIRTTT